MTARWFDIPVGDWVTLNAKLRGLAQTVNADIAAIGGTPLPPGGGTGEVLTKLSATDGDADWLAIPAPVVPVVVPIHADATGAITLTNQVAAEQFLGNSNRNIWLLDLSAATEVRLVTRVVTSSASVNNPRILVRYRSAFSTTVGDYAGIGASEVSCSMASTGIADSGWVALAAGAQIAACYVAVTQIGGDAAADPVLGAVQLWIR